MNLKEINVNEEAKIKGSHLSFSVSCSGVLTVKCAIYKRTMKSEALVT